MRSHICHATEALTAVTFADLAPACVYLGVSEETIRATISELRHELRVEHQERT